MPPVAVALSVVLEPLQISLSALALTVATGLTVTFTVSRLKQPLLSVTNRMYCVVVVGLATGDKTLADESPAAGVQAYVKVGVPPLTVVVRVTD